MQVQRKEQEEERHINRKLAEDDTDSEKVSPVSHTNESCLTYIHRESSL